MSLTGVQQRARSHFFKIALVMHLNYKKEKGVIEIHSIGTVCLFLNTLFLFFKIPKHVYHIRPIGERAMGKDIEIDKVRCSARLGLVERDGSNLMPRQGRVLYRHSSLSSCICTTWVHVLLLSFEQVKVGAASFWHK